MVYINKKIGEFNIVEKHTLLTKKPVIINSKDLFISSAEPDYYNIDLSVIRKTLKDED